MSATIELDTRGFRRALNGLAQFSGRGVSHVIRAEAGSILKACAGSTKVATKATADRRAIARALNTITYRGKASSAFGYLTINSGLRGGDRGRMWHRTARGKFQTAGQMSLPGGSYRWAWIHFTDDMWADMQAAAAKASAAIKQFVPLARGSIGLARQSWVQIADGLGIRLESVPGGRISAAGIAKARAALASNGQAYVNGTGTEHARAKEFFVLLRNRLPYGRKIQLDSILARAVQGRVRFFEQNLARGTFDELKRIARAYPGLDLRRN